MKRHLLILTFVLAANITFGQAVLYENFESTSNPDLITKSGDGGGTYSATATPPNNLSQNTSAKCAYYLRNAGNYWDNVVYTLDSKMDDPSAFASASPGANVFKIKVATTAAAGVRFVISLQSTTLAGVHSEYEATTTATNNDWETLTFSWIATNNGALANTEVDKILIFPAANTNSGDQFFMDDIQGPALLSLSTKNASSQINTSKLYPNPATGIAFVELELKSESDVKMVLTNMIGKELKVIKKESASTFNESFDVTGFEKGIYFVNYYINNEPVKAEKLVVN